MELVESRPFVRSFDLKRDAAGALRLFAGIWDNNTLPGVAPPIHGVYYSDDGGVTWFATTDDDLNYDAVSGSSHQ
jgi:hypothetical protein